MTERREPTLDAAEIHLMDPREDVGPPDLRADPVAADSIKRRRGGSTRFVLFGASLAILAGFGVLAATVGTATLVPREAPVEESSASLSPLEAVATSEAASDKAAPAGVRTIPLNAGEEVPAAAAAEADVTPPVPRPRPEAMTASAEPTSGPADPAPATAAEPQPAATPRPATASAERQASPQPQASPTGNNALILSIEETLAKIDTTDSAGPSETTGSAALPPVLPPPASYSSASSVPPAAAVPPTYPPPGYGYPSSAGASGPYHDVMPPQFPSGEGGGTTSSGPVPPEPVPYVYPPSPIVYPPSYVEAEPPVRRRGIVRRTADAVVRVFSRD